MWTHVTSGGPWPAAQSGVKTLCGWKMVQEEMMMTGEMHAENQNGAQDLAAADLVTSDFAIFWASFWR